MSASVGSTSGRAWWIHGEAVHPEPQGWVEHVPKRGAIEGQDKKTLVMR